MEYRISIATGDYICGYCGKAFPAFYAKKGPAEQRRTMSRKLSGAANFYRHLRTCERKTNTVL